MPAPLPPKQAQGEDYGDYPGAMRATRTNTQVYNAVVIPRIRKATENRDAMIERHNASVDEQNAACDALWRVYEEKVLAIKTRRQNKTFNRVFGDF